MFNPRYAIALAFAGAWSQVWHFGTGVALIVLLVAAAIFTTSIPVIGPYLQGARNHLLWAALGVGLFVGGQWLGAHDANKRHAAQQVVVEQHVDTVVEKTKSPRLIKQKDKWDNPEY